MPLRYAVSFTETGQRFQVVNERIENEKAYPGHDGKPYFYYSFERNHPVLNVKGTRRRPCGGSNGSRFRSGWTSTPWAICGVWARWEESGGR